MIMVFLCVTCFLIGFGVCYLIPRKTQGRFIILQKDNEAPSVKLDMDVDPLELKDHQIVAFKIYRQTEIYMDKEEK